MTSELHENSKGEVLARRVADPVGLKDVTPIVEPSWQERTGRALAAMVHNRGQKAKSKKSLTSS